MAFAAVFVPLDGFGPSDLIISVPAEARHVKKNSGHPFG